MILTKQEEKAIYETYLAIRPEKGKWIRLVRVPGERLNVYTSYSFEAQNLAAWLKMTLLTDTAGNRFVRFGEPALATVQEKAREKDYRVIIVDAPVAVQGNKNVPTGKPNKKTR